MTQNAFAQMIESLGSLSPEQMRQLRHELDGKLASEARPTATPTRADEAEEAPDPLSGIWRDYADEMDEIVADAYRHRREDKWREIDL